MASLVGYLIKYDSTNNKSTTIPYADIYTNRRILYQLKNDINNCNISFSCSCTNQLVSLKWHNNAHIELNHEEHTSECNAQYSQMLYEIFETKKGDLLRGQLIDLHLSLKRDVKPSLNVIDSESIFRTPIFGNMDLATYIGFNNIISFNRQTSNPVNHPSERNSLPQDFQNDLLFQFGLCKLRDLQGNYFSVTPSTFLNEHVETGKTYFYYGRIVETEIHRQYIHITCAFRGDGVVITIPLNLWLRYSEFVQNTNKKLQFLWFAGFVRVVERTRQSKGSYDSYTHTYYSGGKQKIQEFTLKHGVLFRTNLYGLICFSDEEAIEGNTAVDQGLGLIKPLFPFYRSDQRFLGYNSSLISRSNDYVYYFDDVKK